MAGHSKWANIKHKKAAADAKRGKVFTRLIREITVAARLGGGDASANPRLRLAIDKAMDQNMPKDTIERAIKRGSGGLEGVNYEEIRYEGYGINGAAVIVDCMTDNRTRTVADVRHAFSKYGGNLGTDGSVAFLFKHCGQIVFAPGDRRERGDGGGDRCRRRRRRHARRRQHRGDHRAARLHRASRTRSRSAGFKPEFAEVTMKPLDRSRDARRGRAANAEAARRARVARRRAGRLHVRGARRSVAPDATHPRHRPWTARHRLRRARSARQHARLRRQRLHSRHRLEPARAARRHRARPGARDRRARPTEVAVEKVFVNINPHSTLLLGQARGAAIAAAVLAGLPVSEYTAGQVKQAVVGAGRALKPQVQEMVRRLLELPGLPASDAADALACAICHAHASTGVGALAPERLSSPWRSAARHLIRRGSRVSCDSAWASRATIARLACDNRGVSIQTP